jgi:hypothetical protein
MKSHILNLGIEIIVAVIVLIGYGFWYAEVAAKSAAVAELQNQIATKTETASRIASARVAIAEITSDEAIVQGYFVPESNVVAFINDLEAQGRMQDATTSVLSVSAGTSDASPTLLFSIVVKGSFDAVMCTVGTIEYMPYDLSILKLSLVQNDKNSWQSDLSIRVGSVKTTPQTQSL